jgi:hypothetical protein
MGSQEPNEWKSIRLCRKSYSKRVIKILMCKNANHATFLLRQDGNDYVLKYRALTEGYGEKAIIDELNYYLFVEEQRKIAEPIRKAIVDGLVKKFSSKD